MSAGEYGGAKEDLKVVFKIKTSWNKENIRDLSLVISGGSGREETLPDLLGYTVCSGSNNNTEARIQRQSTNLVSITESLEPDTEYRITVERTGGRIRRLLKNLKTGEETPVLEVFDANAIYDRQNHIGFTTFSGEAEFFDIEIYTRKSKFSIDQFKISLDAEAGIRDNRLKGRIFKLRFGKDPTSGKSFHVVMFEDITERKKMQRELEESREQLRNLSAYLQSVREQEGARIAREVHDELGQILTALKIDLGWMASKFNKDQKVLIEKTKMMTNFIDTAINIVRKISGELRPRLLDDLGLAAAIEWETEQFRERTGIKCSLDIETDDLALESNLSTNVFRIFQETLTNVARHSGATAVKIRLEEKNGLLILKVVDNGIGITKEKIYDPKSFGLIGIRERLSFLGGQFKIKGHPGKGTTITVTIPLARK